MSPLSITRAFSSIFCYVRTTTIECHSCHCWFESTESRFVSLPLPTLSTLNSSIQSCIRKWFEPACLCGLNQYDCPTCKRKQDASQYTRIKQWPEVLTVFLQMSSLTSSDSFAITEELELPGSSTHYQLQCLSLFQGNDSEGHYIAMIKCNNEWIVYSDNRYFKTAHIEDWKRLHRTSVSSYPFHFVPYLLFYQRVPVVTKIQSKEPVSTPPQRVAGITRHVKVDIPPLPMFPEQLRRPIPVSFHFGTDTDTEDSQSSQSSDLNVCPYCSKSFTRGSSLTRHKAMHSAVRLWKCRFFGCNRSFYRKDKRDEHEKCYMHVGRSEITASSDSSGVSEKGRRYEGLCCKRAQSISIENWKG